MAYYSKLINNGNTALNLYTSASTYFPTANSSGYSCTAGTSTIFNIATGYFINMNNSYTQIYGLDFSAYSPSVANNDDSTPDINITNSYASYTGTTTVYFSTTVDGPFTSTGQDITATTPTRWINNSFDMGTTYYLKLYNSTYGYSGVSAGIQPCGGSTNAANCCSGITTAVECISTIKTACASSARATCVDGTTKILMANNTYKLAKNVHIGDLIISKINDELVPQRVTMRYLGLTAKYIYKLTLSNSEYLFITEHHPISCKDCYKNISGLNYTKISIGDYINCSTGLIELIQIQRYSNESITYNFLTEADNFIANNFVVACEDPATPYYLIPEVGDGVKTCNGCGAISISLL